MLLLYIFQHQSWNLLNASYTNSVTCKPKINHLNRRILVKIHSITIQHPAVYKNHVLSAVRSPFRINIICNIIIKFDTQNIMIMLHKICNIIAKFDKCAQNPVSEQFLQVLYLTAASLKAIQCGDWIIFSKLLSPAY